MYEHEKTVYVVSARLKVMLDVDYESANSNVEAHPRVRPDSGQTQDLGRTHGSAPTDISTQIIREIILPAIEKEVNEGQNFAPLRQIYHSLILAKWYKETIKNSLLSKIYIDKNKTAGINLNDATIKDKIYAQYMEAYKKGVFNYIKEDYDRLKDEVIPRKYFSGGIERLMNFNTIVLNKTTIPDTVSSAIVGSNFKLTVQANPQGSGDRVQGTGIMNNQTF